MQESNHRHRRWLRPRHARQANSANHRTEKLPPPHRGPLDPTCLSASSNRITAEASNIARSLKNARKLRLLPKYRP
jgi:hypothetical protein